MTTQDLRIRRVNVEFLRAGPSHNQLLSPYTHYLAVCNDAGAAIVTVPYEHRAFERVLKQLRYETGEQSDRLNLLHEVGCNVGKILESVPGFTGALVDNPGRGATLVHVRIVLSAAELALLPFEVAQVPVGSASSALSIQTRPHVSVTRHIRTVSSEGLDWPDRPRVLFVSGDPSNVPFMEHRAALISAIERFKYPQRDDAKVTDKGRREQFGDLLTILVDPTLLELQRECESADYTHIHVLTHGDNDAVSQESFGLAMRDESGAAADVVTGERFVSAVTRVGHRPSVITVAACDSGNVGSVVIPGASFVHAVHQAGIPFVVGAQFPLSKDGSIPLTERLYNGLLWGDHPLHVLQQARADLHARYMTNWHDWAAVVVYEALPPDLDDQLDRLRYSQTKRAMNAALEAIDLAVASRKATNDALVRLNEAVSYATGRMPLEGQYRVECIGLRASSQKRQAYAAFMLAGNQDGNSGPFDNLYDLLDRARLDYQRAARGLLVNDSRALQRNATLHWVLVQAVSLSAVLEHRWNQGEWDAAFLSADQYRDHPDAEQRAWAHASLAELWLLRLTKPGIPEDERAKCLENARTQAEELDRFYPGIDEFPVKSTRRQFERYIGWWADDRFESELDKRGRTRPAAWKAAGGVAEVAQRLADILRRGTPVESGPGSSGPATPPTPAATTSGAATTPTAAAPAVVAKGGNGGVTAKLSGRRQAETPRADEPRREGAFFTIEALPAGHGDCLWIEYGDRGTTHRVLIDCGTQGTAKALLARVDAVPANERFLELFVLSHIDSDHIGGALPFFKAVKRGLRFGDVWFNGWRHVSGKLGARQGEMFSTAIQDFELPWNTWRDGKTILVDAGDPPQHVLPGGMKLTLLSPRRAELDKLAPIWTRELKRYALEPGGRVDYSRFLKGTPSTKADAAALKDVDSLADVKFAGDGGAPNGTSIALLAEFGGARALLAADAHAPVLVQSIRKLLKPGETRLKVDLYKVSHHGSQNNVSSELVQLLDCPQYLISTNGDHFFHPDRQAIARILKYGGDKKTIIFNYNNRLNDVWGDAALENVRQKYNCTMSYPPADRPGTIVTLL